MTTTNLTDAQFQTAEGKLDALTRKTRRGTVGTADEIALYKTIYGEWEAAYALPQRTVDQRKTRDAALSFVATRHGLVSL